VKTREPRLIVNVAAGTEATDAVNKSQLDTMAAFLTASLR
jgi:hypothetical protein